MYNSVRVDYLAFYSMFKRMTRQSYNTFLLDMSSDSISFSQTSLTDICSYHLKKIRVYLEKIRAIIRSHPSNEYVKNWCSVKLPIYKAVQPSGYHFDCSFLVNSCSLPFGGGFQPHGVETTQDGVPYDYAFLTRGYAVAPKGRVNSSSNSSSKSSASSRSGYRYNSRGFGEKESSPSSSGPSKVVGISRIDCGVRQVGSVGKVELLQPWQNDDGTLSSDYVPPPSYDSSLGAKPSNDVSQVEDCKPEEQY
jgi:hypothetical protein